MFGFKKNEPPSVEKRMEVSLYEVAPVRFCGNFVWPTLRKLNYTQIKTCGDFSLIETFQDKIDLKEKKVTFDEMCKFAELQHNIVKMAMISPTYDQVIKLANKYDQVEADKLEENLAKIKEMFLDMPDDDKVQKKELQEKYAQLEMRYRYILPDDFITDVFSFALRINESDIKLITEEMLYNAACKANLGHDNPADHLGGAFTEFNKEDINERSWIIYFDKKKELQENKKGA